MSRIASHGVCENHRKLDTTTLARNGLLSGSGTLTWSSDGSQVAVSGYGNGLRLTFAVDDEAIVERIKISKTRPHLGGERCWFLCPGCDRRITALYQVKYFRCRHCHDLRYQSQRETPRFRAISRIQRLRMKLGGSANLLDKRPARPRYMHARTYQRLLKAEAATTKAYIIMVSHRANRLSYYPGDGADTLHVP